MNINDIIARANQVDGESFEKYDKLKNVKSVYIGDQRITNDDEDEYEYIDTRAASFDVKINVCKWITRKYSDKQDGVYDLSVRKNGMMAYPEALVKLACGEAYNYLLSDYACIVPAEETERKIYLDYTELTSAGVIEDKTYELTVRDHNSTQFNGHYWIWNESQQKYIEDTSQDAVPVDWYLSFPYGMPFDLIESHPDMRTFAYNIPTTSTSDTLSPYKIASNCITCFDPRIDHNNYSDCRYIAVVIGAVSHFNVYSNRNSIISSQVKSMEYPSDPAFIMSSGEEIARQLYDWKVNNKNGTAINEDTVKCLYCSISKVNKDGTYSTLYSYYNPATKNSRLHIITCGTQLLLAKYLQECGEDEIVDFEYETMRSYELSRPSQPKVDTSMIFTNECAGIKTYGNNATIYNMTGSLEDVLLCSLNSDNTYCTYALLLHYYKGLTHTSKDTVQPLIQQIASFDEGYISITFPEANRSNVQTAGGESSLQYASRKTQHSMKEPVNGTTASTTTWPNLYTPTYNDYVYKVNLADDYITFKDFSVDKQFTFTMAIAYKDIMAISGKKEILIATLGNAKIYLCKNGDSIYPTISTTYYTDSMTKASSAIKIIDGKQQVILGIGQYYNTAEADRDYNLIITISYNNGLWDIHKSHEGRGRN